MKDIKNNLEHLELLLNIQDISITEREFIFNDQGEPINYKFIYANKTFCDLIRKDVKDVIGKDAFMLFPKSKDYWIKEYYEVVMTGKPLITYRYEKRLERHFTVYIYKTGDISFSVSFIDITNILKNANKYADFRVTGDNIRNISKIGFFEVNRLTLKADVSELFYEVIGQETIREGFFRHTLLKLTHPDEYDKIFNFIKDVSSGDIQELESNFRLYNEKKDYYHWMNIFVFAIEQGDDGKPIRYTGMVRDIEDEKNKVEEAIELEELFKEARRVADLSTFIYNVETSLFNQSDELDDFTGVDNLTTIEQFRSIVHPDDLEIYDKATEYTLNGSRDKVTIYRIFRGEKIKFVQSSVFGKSNSAGKVIKVFGILKDITDIEKQRRIAVKLQNSFELIYNSSPAGIFLLNSKLEISQKNATFREFFDFLPSGMSFITLLGDSYDKVVKDLKNGKDIKGLRVKHNIENNERHFVINIIKISKKFQNAFEGTLVDITQQVKGEKRILYLATHDVLTDLYNRNYFEELVAKKEKIYPLGLVLCDIDGLKLINDAFGHLKGDELLRSLAKALKGLSSDYISARIGGDEFAILVEDANEEQLENIELEIKESIKDLGFFGIDFEVSLGYAILKEETTDFNIGFNSAENMMYRRKLTERSSRKSDALETIMQTLYEKTEETKDHCERVGDYARTLLSEAGYKRTADLENIRFLSKVHDIGKIATPERILNKKTELTEDEYETMKHHCEAGYKIIKNIIDNESIASGVLYHHERYDGKGYPHGLQKEEIPLYARILAIVETYDIMIQGRGNQKPISKKEALEDLKRNRGTQFDPALVDSFIKIMSKKS